MDILNQESLIETHEKLNEFAKYHQNKGAQNAHKLIKRILIDDVKGLPRDGSKEGKLRNEGYDEALKKVLKLIHENFVI